MDNFNLKQYLAEGRLFKEVEGSNPVFDEYMKIRNSIDYKTVFPSDLDDFVKGLDNTDRENLQRDLENHSNDDLTEGKKENPLKVTWNDDLEEVELEWDGYSYESYTGTYDPSNPNDTILFLHYFDGAIPYMPSSFEYLEQHGGETDIDHEESTLTISVKDLKKATPSLN